jgi:uncharacterized protein (DUF362 family)
MSRKVSRRSFVKQSSVIGASSILGAELLTGQNQAKRHSIGDGLQVARRYQGANTLSVVTGQDYVDNTIGAVGQLGGMGRFVPEGAKVAVLANPQRPNPGAFTRPDIVRAVVRMCRDAGADEVACITWQSEQSWEQTGTAEAVSAEGGQLVFVDMRDESLFEPIAVPGGVALKEARVMKALADYDVLIDLPITKDHAGNKFTGTLKNLMGLNSPVSNRTFHMDNWTTDIGAITHLDQCIADLNTIIHPDLCVVDATELLTTNGPFGPGELIRPQKIIVGTDRVAVDAYCAGLLELNPHDIMTITKAHEHGLGEIDLSTVNLIEA